MSSESGKISLWCFYWIHGESSPFEVRLALHEPISRCRLSVMNQAGRSDSPLHHTFLYRVPHNHPKMLRDHYFPIKALSILDLGSPLAVYQSVESIFGTQPDAHVPHLVLVDRNVMPIYLWVPSVQRQLLVNVKIGDMPLSFMHAIKEEYPTLKEVDFAYFKTPYTNMDELRDVTKDHPLDIITLLTAFDDVPASKFPCITVEVLREVRIRKHRLSNDLVEDVNKHCKLIAVAPFAADNLSVRANRSEQTLNYRTPVDYAAEFLDKKLPPIEVLFKGFGQFLDIWRGASAFGTRPDLLVLDNAVDNFVRAMSRTYVDEEARRTEGLKCLNALFPNTQHRSPITPSKIPRIRTSSACSSPDHSLYGPRDIPCMIAKFKNDGGSGSNASVAAELVSYYRLTVDRIAANNPAVVRASRLPAIGITIIGPCVTFFGLAFVDSPVCLPLTTGLWCLPVECGGSDRHLLYAAFKAASDLLETIDAEAARLSDGHPVPIYGDPLFPQFRKLNGFGGAQPITFQITGTIEKDISRHVYHASSDAGDLVIKLARSYSPQLHMFCAELGCAPKLYGFEELPGGIIAIAMERIVGKPLAPTDILSIERRKELVDDLTTVVAKMHIEGYVHGDLRPPNIMCVGDRIMLLDFDWGGEVGMAHYPHTRLHPDLQAGREMSSLEITPEDDRRILQRTLDFLMGDAGDVVLP